ncbi:MAG: restriction endonuclease subunit S [Spirochaetes bacterium]|nr:restriction endonuclease subunit S [Spirochaetota bacterium]
MELLQKHFDTALESPDGIKKLRELILTLAMQGKLVKQDPKDQPASELLKEIQAEKEKIASREGAKARGKKLRDFTQRHEVAKEEKPYELPENWEWVRLGDICLKVSDGFHHSAKKITQGIKYISATHINNGWIDWNSGLFVSEKEYYELLKKTDLKAGDILIVNRGAGCGDAAIINTDEKFCFQNAAIIGFPQDLIFGFYLLKYIHKSKGYFLEKFIQGGAQPMLSNKLLATHPFPLPPLAEQKRIVAKIDELMKLCDKLEKQRNARKEKILAVHRATINQLLESSPRRDIAASRANSSFSSFESETVSQAHSQSSPRRDIASSRANSLSSSTASRANSSFSSFESETVSQAHSQSSPRRDIASSRDFLFANFDPLYSVKENVAELKKAILTLAMQGKLVSQNPNDQPASELLKEIQAEKEKIASREGAKARGKGKELPPIKPEEIPYELPESWEWVKVEDVFNTTSGTTFDLSLERETGEYLYVKVGDMNLSENSYTITTSSRFIDPDKKMINSIIPKGSIIFPKRGGAIATNKKRIIERPVFVDLNIMAITPTIVVLTEFAYKWIFNIDLAKLNTGTSVPQINHKDIDPLFFPLPPLAEQKRIVAKIDELMELCDRLEQQIDQATAKQTALFDAVLAKV